MTDTSKEFVEKAKYCDKEQALPHDYLVIGWTGNDRSKQATRLMCQRCLYNVNLTDLWSHQDKC